LRRSSLRSVLWRCPLRGSAHSHKLSLVSSSECCRGSDRMARECLLCVGVWWVPHVRILQLSTCKNFPWLSTCKNVVYIEFINYIVNVKFIEHKSCLQVGYSVSGCACSKRGGRWKDHHQGSQGTHMLLIYLHMRGLHITGTQILISIWKSHIYLITEIRICWRFIGFIFSKTWFAPKCLPSALSPLAIQSLWIWHSDQRCENAYPCFATGACGNQNSSARGTDCRKDEYSGLPVGPLNLVLRNFTWLAVHKTALDSRVFCFGVPCSPFVLQRAFEAPAGSDSFE
jgi:hypothetical protein